MYVEVLENGLRIIVDKRPLHSVGIALAVGVGSIYEDRRKRGISHIAEHVVFRAFPNVDLLIEGLGGMSDAYTERTLTMFLFEVIPENVGKLVRLIDAMFKRRASEEDFERERRVVLSELKMRLDDPGTFIYDLGFKALFGDSDYGDPVIGFEETVKSITFEDVIRFIEDYYTPDNMTLTIVGPVRDEDVRLIKEVLSKWEGKRRPLKRPEYGSGVDELVVRRSSDSVYAAYAWCVPLNGKSLYELAVMAALLEFHLVTGLGSILTNRLRTSGVSYYVDLERELLPTHYVFEIVIEGVDPEKIDDVRRGVVESLVELRERLNDEDYMRKRANFMRYLLMDFMRRPIQMAESMAYLALRIGICDIDAYCNDLLRLIRAYPEELLKGRGSWAFIMPE